MKLKKMLSLFSTTKKKDTKVQGPVDVRVMHVSKTTRNSLKRRSPMTKRATCKIEGMLDSSLKNGSRNVSVDEMDDDALERLVGGATHLSLGRKGSKGVLVRIPSCERFDSIVSKKHLEQCMTSSDEDTGGAKSPKDRRASGRRSNKDSSFLSPQTLPRSLSKRTITMTKKYSITSATEDATMKGVNSVNGFEVDGSVDDEQNVDSPRCRRKLSRNLSRERLDTAMRVRRTSFSN